MSNLAIRGHATRSKEVIEILDMLSGRNASACTGANINTAYVLASYGSINIIDYVNLNNQEYNLCLFTLEEFLEKFPYKVGDKALAFGNKCTIIDAVWDGGIDEVVYTIKLDTNKYTTTKLSNQLQPYKKEIMEDITKIDIPKGYEFAGIDNQQVVFEKIGYHYPKTYEECCDVLNIDVSRTIEHSEDCSFYKDITCYENGLLLRLAYLRKLLVCRETYWKIAGEQMGLGKPWEPDWRNSDADKHCIEYSYGRINSVTANIYNYILAFPTEEMRDAFYKNFKDLIEKCKELL